MFPHAGPQKELDIWPVFGVLADLLVRPGGIASVHLFMIGPDVPEDMHNKQQLLGATMKHRMHCNRAEEGAVRQATGPQSQHCLKNPSHTTYLGSRTSAHAGGGCVRVTFSRSLYHLFVNQEVYHTPNLICAPNAGKFSKTPCCCIRP